METQNIPPVGKRGPFSENWLVEAILVTILCCLPLGIVGIVNSAQVNSRLATGDTVGAERARSEAAKWTKLGFWIGIAVIVLYLIFIFVLGGTAFWAASRGIDTY